MRYRSYAIAGLLCCLAMGHALHASTFILGHDPNQIFDSENVGPYPGTLTGSPSTNFFCLDDTLTATFGVSYAGTVVVPTTQQEEEAAFLASYALYFGAPGGAQSIVSSIEGPVSFAIWQIMGTLGNTPPDPRAQPYIQTAQYAYSHNLIPQSYLDTVLIFKPNDNRIQRFITAVPDGPMVASALSSGAPEPASVSLLAGGLILLAWRSRALFS